ncbi:hypothetical protein [Alienimonas chondri]|uniref:Uncharacterized protein n=1 Tax=Alienimonas chondri TaxID=2681879 RepID=A0ABX1VDS1_9PLAN|nr:hypothetical protein [Alienimonas chondri]NNJ25670.1 hypothetical protein [Alienimonas chondri]
MTRRLFPLFAATLALAVFAPTAPAASPVEAKADEIVAYRAVKWQSSHFEDADKAATHAKTLKKLGCEVKTGAHGGHTDVSHRCPEWREIALATHEKAHEWEEWLKANGFETRHAH